MIHIMYHREMNRYSLGKPRELFQYSNSDIKIYYFSCLLHVSFLSDYEEDENYFTLQFKSLTICILLFSS